MLFNTHSNLAGRHAFLSASKYHWTNYDDEKLDRVFISAAAAKRGTELHELAHNLIRLGVKLPTRRTTLNAYVNDAIGYRMTPEQMLYVTDNAFGTADAISFRRSLLRIHDLKTGELPGNIRQLEIYAAFFCLEYGVKPADIGIELRIYQNDETLIFEADPMVIAQLMVKTIEFSRRIDQIKMEGLL